MLTRSSRNYFIFYLFLIIGGIIYAFSNPYGENSFLPKCIIHSTTGLYCAGCGLQRALHSFFIGDFVLAFKMNPLVVLALVFLCIDFLLLLLRMERYRPLPVIINSHVALLSIAVILLMFMVLRNVDSEYLQFLKPSA